MYGMLHQSAMMYTAREFFFFAKIITLWQYRQMPTFLP